MDAKYCVIALLWLVASRGEESVPFARVADITNSNEECYIAFVTQSTNEVGWFTCRRVLAFIKAIDMGPFECKRLTDYADTPNPEDYFVFVTRYRYINEVDWLVRIKLSYKNTTDEKWAECRELDDFSQITELDYVVFIRHCANTNQEVWFVCERVILCDCNGCSSWSI